ncbi:MAG: LysM peptidoglycan-binding domain-containing protein [Bacteroidales bacterium]|nr:LysM peptidoglycan-binding domain-containing protein [Bacteroidales bacterium]NLO49655.1 LysM peptidoglycan-binding domain-containing protein [Bacteroidales bacterium]
MHTRKSNISTALAAALIISLFASCSMFRLRESAGVPQKSTKNVVNGYQRDLHYDFQSEDELGDLLMVPDTALSYDTVSTVESIHFRDSLLSYSNEMLNDDERAMILVEASPAMRALDSLVNMRFFNDDHFITDRDKLNVYHWSVNDVPIYPDSVIERRIALLNRHSPFELTYNKTVGNFIDLYANRKRDLSARLLGLAEIYFPMFEEILDSYNLPLELKYLAVVESALIPNAGSHAGAKGLWQFMYNTGKVYGLQVTSLVDDRYDPYKSTVAAAEHLRDLYAIYHDWSLVLAAYNSGAGNVNKAIRRSGGVKNYWAIWPYLPRETRGYVPAFIAVNYLMNFAPEHNLFPVDPGILYNGIDTVMVNRTLSFDQISEYLNMPIDDIQFLNPSFKLGIIPANSLNLYALRLPREVVGEFVSNEKDIYNYKSTKGLAHEQMLKQIEKAKQRQVHVVRSGENLSTIASRYRCSVSNLRSWNNLRGNTIHPGQKLVVHSGTDSQSASSSAVPAAKETTAKAESKTYHVVKNGENLGLIAKKYKCSTNDLRKWNNLKSNTIYPRQKLLVSQPVADNSNSRSKTSDANSDYIIYTVKQGDTLWDIAKQYDGVTVDQIKRLNNITNTRSLRPGQKIKVVVKG